MAVVATLKDGRIKASGSTTITPTAAGDYAITITISECRKVEKVVNYNITVSPLVDPGTPVNTVITDNVVGCTLLGVAAGCTITVEAIAVGF